jgi:hypothetical protein
VCLFDCSACAIWCTALLWRSRCSPFMWGFEHVESRCGQVSTTLLEHSVQFRFGCGVGQKIFCDGCPCIDHCIKILMFV